MPIVVVDLDGTLFDNTHRENLLPKGCGTTTEQWEKFNKACVDDSLIEHTADLVRMFHREKDYLLVIVTGRAEHCREETMKCLRNHLPGVRFFGVFMRPNDDHRTSVDFKRDIFTDLGLLKQDLVMEDDPAVVKMLTEEFDCSVMAVKSKCSAVTNNVSQQKKSTFEFDHVSGGRRRSDKE